MRQKKNFTETDLFKIEKGQKIPLTRYDHATTARIRKLMDAIKVKESFVVTAITKQS